MQVKIAFQHLISSSFNFFHVLKGCFDKLGCDSVDVSKIGYFSPS